MIFLDCHADTLTKWAEGDFDTHVKRLTPSNIQIFAAFEGRSGDKRARVKKLINAYDGLSGFVKIRSAADFSRLGDMPASILSTEGGDIIESEEDVAELYGRGVRIMGLAWNKNSPLAGAASDEDTGLTPLGERAVRKMEALGVTVDLSHAGEKSFYDVLKLAKKPVICSHSNSYTLCPHERNIKDGQFYELKKNGGAVGINFYPPFLCGKKACADDILRHIDYFLSLGGEDNVGIGTDFDGVDCLPDGVSGSEYLYTLYDRLLSLYGEAVAQKVAGLNFLRILKNNMR